MITLTTLSNGFRIVTDPMPGLQSATVGVWVGAGARHETAGQTGIAHFLEHMAFKGTARRSARQIAEAIEDVGGYINAYTSRETTAYYARVLAADVPLALDVIADIVLNPAFDPAEIETERHVILQEIGQALDTPDDIVFDWLQETAFPDQPMGRPILGPAENVARFAGGERRELRDLEQVHMALAFPAPAWSDPDLYAAQIYATLMGGGMSSRLFQTLREEAGLCYSVFAQASAHEDTGILTLYAGTGAEDVAELAERTIAELRRAPGDITRAEVDRARAQMRAGLLMGQESPSARAERLARHLAIWDRVPPIEEIVARIDAVGLTEARGFAEALAAGGQMAMALYGPAEGAPDAATLAARLAA